MQITSLIDLVDGVLLNSPSITSIYNIITDIKKVKEACLFICKNEKDIPEAIEKGAFAIVVEKPCEIIDNEIAWILVKSIEETLIKLIRFKLSKLNLNSYYCDHITLEFIKIEKNTSTIIITPDKLDLLLKRTDDIEDNFSLFSEDKLLLKKIYPNTKEFKITNYRITNLIEHSLFETTFSHKESYFNRLKIPHIYINHFLCVYYFLQKEFDLSKLKKFSLFKPIFIDKNLNSVEYGLSNKFIIAQNNIEIAKLEITYLQKKFSYAKQLIISAKDFGLMEFKYILENDIDKIKTILKNKDFNSVYLIGFKHTEIENKLLNQEEEDKLL